MKKRISLLAMLLILISVLACTPNSVSDDLEPQSPEVKNGNIIQGGG